MNENTKEYGEFTFDISDNIIDKKENKMKNIKFTTDPTGKVYSKEEEPPIYYLPVYIDIFNSKYKKVNDIIDPKTTLEKLFTKGFNDFITTRLKQPLTPKTCINFIKDKALVQQFITDYSSKNTSSNIYQPSNIDNYKTFLRNVYIFLIKIMLTDAGSFLYKNPQNNSEEISSNSELINKKLYYIKLINPFTDIDINSNIQNFIDNNKTINGKCETSEVRAKKAAAEKAAKAEKAAAAKEAKAAAKAAKAAAAEEEGAEGAEEGGADGEDDKDGKDNQDEEDNTDDTKTLKIADHISLNIKQDINPESTTRNILDNFFQSKQNKIIKENSYDSTSELNYNKLLKVTIIDTILNNRLFTQTEYTKKCFEPNDGNTILNELVGKIQAKKEPIKFYKTDAEIKADIRTALRIYYIEKGKNTEKKGKKIYINIIFVKDSNSNVVLVTTQPYEGLPTFNDIINFQKKLQEDISKYIKKCQDPPKDIESEVKEQCTKIVTNSKRSPNMRNILWSNLCTNYIKCVYDDTYDPNEEIEEIAEREKTEKANSARKLAEGKLDAAEITPIPMQPQRPILRPIPKQIPGLIQRPPPRPMPRQPQGQRRGKQLVQFGGRKTISKKQISKPDSSRISLKIKQF